MKDYLKEIKAHFVDWYAMGYQDGYTHNPQNPWRPMDNIQATQKIREQQIKNIENYVEHAIRTLINEAIEQDRKRILEDLKK